MPELPEVETVRRCLEPVLTGADLVEVAVRHPRLARRNRSAAEIEDRLTGATVSTLRRHGKFLIADLDQGSVWVIHLGMSGHLRIAEPAEAEEAHTHVVVRTGGGKEIRMIDPRTFGFVAVLTPAEWEEAPFSRHGPDALDQLPVAARLANGLEGRRVPIKARLLDQTFLAGLGNIYADEVLHRSGLRPTRSAGSLRPGEVSALRSAIKPVLRAGIRWGGTSLNDLAYLLPDGAAGRYLERLHVYGREGQPCARCRSPIVRSVVAGRSTYYCPACQR